MNPKLHTADNKNAGFKTDIFFGAVHKDEVGGG
jgi:hypothetical protein